MIKYRLQREADTQINEKKKRLNKSNKSTSDKCVLWKAFHNPSNRCEKYERLLKILIYRRVKLQTLVLSKTRICHLQ